MKFLAKALKWILILLLLLAAAAALTALAWYQDWPLLTGVVVLAGLSALYLIAKGLRILWKWRDKRAFVAKIMSEHTSAAPQEAVGAIDAAWQQGMECVRLSPGRFARQLRHSQPWFLALGQGGEFSPFDPFGRKIPDGEAPLRWHFLADCVILHSDGYAGSQDWESLLAKLASKRRSIPLRGLILSCSIADLEEKNEADLAALGQQLRLKAQQVMQSLDGGYPVYLLIQGLEKLAGIPELLNLIPRERTDAPLGLRYEEPETALGKKAADAAADHLEDLLLDAAAAGDPPSGDSLKALKRLRELGLKLDSVTENLSRELSHQSTPRIAGVFFCASAPVGPGAVNPAFTAEFLSRILPQTLPPQPLEGLPVSAGSKIALMSGWLLLTLCVCGLLAANTIYQYQILNQSGSSASRQTSQDLLVLDQSRGPMAIEFARLYSTMNSIIRLERAHRAWYLPRMGEDMLERSMTDAKLQFVQDVNRLILLPMIDQFRALLSVPASETTRGQDMDLAVELTWLASAVSDRLNQSHPTTLDLERGQASTLQTFPLTQLNETEWTPVTGWLIINALNWVEEREQLTTLQLEIRSLLTQSVTRRGSHMLQNLVAQMDASNEARAIALSQFWRHIPARSIEDITLPFSYTAAGYRTLQNAVEDIRDIAGSSGELTPYLDRFRNEYLSNYADAWEDFARNFVQSGPSLAHENLDAAFIASYGGIKKVADLPHIRFLRRMAAETEPLWESEISREWLGSMDTVLAVTELALARHLEPDSHRLWSAVSMIETSPAVLKRLRNAVRDTVSVSGLIKAAGKMRVTLDNLSALLESVSSPAAAFAFCSAKFGESKGLEAPEALPYDEAERNLGEAFELMECGPCPAWDILQGTLDFVAAEATIQTAQLVQRRWEDEVLNSPVTLYGRGGGDAIFGDQGLVPVFIEKNLGPLLWRRMGAPEPTTWGGVPFPFSDEFLMALAQGESAAAQPLPPEPKDSYRVELRTRPVLVNPDAKLRPTMMTLTLEGADGPQQLINQNFPQDGVFFYSPTKSGRVALVISFPGFDLRRDYGDLKEFIRDFRFGEKTFVGKDFSSGSPKMSAAGIKEVKVPIMAVNIAEIFLDTEADGRNFPDLPSDITRLVIHR